MARPVLTASQNFTTTSNISVLHFIFNYPTVYENLTRIIDYEVKVFQTILTRDAILKQSNSHFKLMRVHQEYKTYFPKP